MSLTPYVYRPMPVEPRSPQPDPDLLQLSDLLRLVRFGWRRKWSVILSLGVCLLLALGYCWFATPTYESRAQVLVAKRRPQAYPWPDPRGTYFEDEFATHVKLIQSPLFVRRAVERLGPHVLEPYAKASDPFVAMVKSLTVTRDHDSDEPISGSSSIIELAFESPDPRDGVDVLNAIIDNYREFLSETSREVNDDALKRITQKAQEVRNELTAKEAQYAEFRKKSPIIWSDATHSPADQLAQYETELSALRIRKAETELRLATFQKALKNGKSDSARLSMVSQEPSHAQSSFEQAVLPLLHEEAQLLLEVGPGHPKVRALREKIDLTCQFYGYSSDDWKIADLRAAGPEAPVRAYVQSLEQELKDLTDQEQALTKMVERQREETRVLKGYEFQDRQFSNDIARIEQIHASLADQLQGVDVGKDLVGYSISTISPPAAGIQVRPRVVLAFTIAGCLGLLLGLGMAYLSEICDERLRTPEEIQGWLGLPVVGYAPFAASHQMKRPRISAGEPALDPLVSAYHRPASLESEAYRGVRTALYYTTRGEHKVIQVTSPSAGDGKTTLAANLAVSIAQSGKRVLLVDANLRQPRVHAIFGNPSEAGLAPLIASEAEISDAVYSSPLPGLDVLPSGLLPPNPAELLTSLRFTELLKYVRDQYDYVLIDTPGILESTDASIVAAQVDGVLLTIRAAKDTRSEAGRATEILATLGATILGVVVSGVDGWSDSGQRPGKNAQALDSYVSLSRAKAVTGRRNGRP